MNNLHLFIPQFFYLTNIKLTVLHANYDSVYVGRELVCARDIEMMITLIHFI